MGAQCAPCIRKAGSLDGKENGLGREEKIIVYLDKGKKAREFKQSDVMQQKSSRMSLAIDSASSYWKKDDDGSHKPEITYVTEDSAELMRLNKGIVTVGVENHFCFRLLTFSYRNCELRERLIIITLFSLEEGSNLMAQTLRLSMKRNSCKYL